MGALIVVYRRASCGGRGFGIELQDLRLKASRIVA